MNLHLNKSNCLPVDNTNQNRYINKRARKKKLAKEMSQEETRGRRRKWAVGVGPLVWGRRLESMKRKETGWARPTLYNGATYLGCNTPC
jgi:hypothetical protein